MLRLSVDVTSRFVFQIWYDVHSAKAYEGGKTLSLPVTLDTVSVSPDPNSRGGGGAATCTGRVRKYMLTYFI